MPGSTKSITTDRHIFWGTLPWAPKENFGVNRRIGDLTQKVYNDSFELLENQENLVHEYGKPPMAFSNKEHGRQIGSTVANVLTIIPDFLVGSGKRTGVDNNELTQLFEHGIVGHVVAGSLGISNVVARGVVGGGFGTVAFAFTPVVYLASDYTLSDIIIGKHLSDAFKAGSEFAGFIVRDLCGGLARCCMHLARLPSLAIKMACRSFGACVGKMVGSAKSASRHITKGKA